MQELCQCMVKMARPLKKTRMRRLPCRNENTNPRRATCGKSPISCSEQFGAPQRYIVCTSGGIAASAHAITPRPRIFILGSRRRLPARCQCVRRPRGPAPRAAAKAWQNAGLRAAKFCVTWCHSGWLAGVSQENFAPRRQARRGNLSAEPAMRALEDSSTEPVSAAQPRRSDQVH
jgi:hypothetical protein